MPQKKRKKIESISDQMKGDKLHLFRLKKFLQYLKQYNAEIKLTKDDGYPQVFKANGKREELKLKHLVAEVLNIREDYAAKLLNGPLTFNDMITDKDRIEDLGDTIDNITVHVGSHLKDDNKEHIPFREVNFGYYGGANELKHENDFEKWSKKTSDNINTPFIQFDQAETIKKDLIHDVNAFLFSFCYLDFLEHPWFREKLKELMSDFEDLYYHFLIAEREIKPLLDTYLTRLENFTPEKSLLPDYVDLSIICNQHNWERSIEKNFKTKSHFKERRNYMGCDERLKFRYEFINMMFQESISFDRWKPIDIALFILCCMEVNSLDRVIGKVVFNFKQKLCFSIYTSNTFNSTKVHLTHQGFESVAEVLMNYHIRDRFSEVFHLNTNSLLNKTFKAHVDPFAVEHYYNESDIYCALHHTINEYVEAKIIKDLNGNAELFRETLDFEL